MKATPIRIIRRRKRSSADGNFFKKENNTEQTFFSDPVHETFFQPVPEAIQRKCASCDEEDKNVKRMSDKKEEEKKMQRTQDKKEDEEKKLKRMPDKKEEDEKKLKRKADDKKEEEKKLQKKEASSNTSPVASKTANIINSLDGKGSKLPNSSLQFFGDRMNHDFSNVRIHTSEEAAASAKEINAKAYTIDHHIVFNNSEYNAETYNGKKLLAHELTHILQQNKQSIHRKEGEKPKEEECKAGSIKLEAQTNASYNKGAGVLINEKRTKSKGCAACEDECLTITGFVKVPYNVTTQVDLPTVPENLSPCQQDRVSKAINGPLTTHENRHVKAFETFNGTKLLPINFKGCESSFDAHTEELAENEFQRRRASADAKSAALDVPPFFVNVDLCCKDAHTK